MKRQKDHMRQDENITMAKNHPEYQRREILRQKDAERRAKEWAEAKAWAAAERLKKEPIVEAVADNVNVEAPVVEEPISEEVSEPIIEAMVVEVPPEALNPTPKTINRSHSGFGGLIELDGQSLKTLMILSTYQDENGKCDPRQNELAERMGISLRSVNTHIGKLTEFTTPDGSKIIEANAVYENSSSKYPHLVYQLLPASGFLAMKTESVEVVEAVAPTPDTFRLKSGSTEPNKRTMKFDEQFLRELEKLEKDFTPSDRLYSTFHNNRSA